MNNGLTTSESHNIQSPPGNSLAVFLDKAGNLQAKDVRGNVFPISNYLPSGSSTTSITRSEALILKSSNSFVAGSFYIITDADINLYGGTQILLTAVSSSELSLQGSGLFYCPKYDLSIPSNGYGIFTTYMQGSFSNILGSFTPGEFVVDLATEVNGIYLGDGFIQWISGDWSLTTSITGATSGATCTVSEFVSPSYSIGQVVHWGGKSWNNVNGNVGSSIDKYTLDSEWTEIGFNSTDYNVFIDEIQYDFDNDMIIYRKDKFNNIVSGDNRSFVEFQDDGGYGYGNPIKDFQWGCGDENFNTDDYNYVGIMNNNIIESYCETLNFRGKYFWGNNMSGFSTFYQNIFSTDAIIEKNTFNSFSGVEINTFQCNFFNNFISNSSFRQNNFNSQFNITNNFAVNSSIISDNICFSKDFTQFSNNTFDNGRFQSNILKNGSSIVDNKITRSFVYNNTLDNSTFFENYLLSSDVSNSNLILSSIEKNIMNINSQIFSFDMSNSVFRNNNMIVAVINNGQMNSNSIIESNYMNYFNINNMALSTGSIITNNSLNYGDLNNPPLTESVMRNVIMNSQSRIIFNGFINFKTIERLEILGSEISLDGTEIIIYDSDCYKKIYNRLDGTPRLQYTDNTDAIVITNINS